MQARDADGPAPLLDTEAWFGRSAPGRAGDRLRHRHLDAGDGEGRTATSTSSRSRSTGAGWRSCFSAIDREGVTNIRLVRGDGVDVLEHMFGPDSLTGVRVFFPDPWPKARHHKRRLLQPATVALIADRLRPGGVLHAATDHAGYAEQIAEVGDAEPRLRRVTADADRCPISVHRPVDEVREARPSTRAAPSPNCSGRDAMSLTEDIRQIEDVAPPP